MNMSRLVFLAGLVVAACGVSSAQMSCNPSDPTGYFEGTAVSRLMGKLEISLNLRYDKGQYSGGMAIPLGPSVLTSGHFENGRLTLTFDSSVAMDLTPDGSLLHGKVTAGDDSGPLEL